MGRDFQRVLRFGGQQDHVKLVSLSVVLNCGNVDSVCPHLSSDAGHSQARSAQCLRRIGVASRKPDGQSSADGTRRNCSTQRADAHYQHLHCEASKMPAMRLNLANCDLLKTSHGAGVATRAIQSSKVRMVQLGVPSAMWALSTVYDTRADGGTSISPLAM